MREDKPEGKDEEELWKTRGKQREDAGGRGLA